MHANSLKLMRELLWRHAHPFAGKTVIDVGSYDVNGTYRPLVQELDFAGYRGIDIRTGPNVNAVVSESGPWDVPLADVIISGQTLEHVRRPWEWIVNVVSILQPGGLVVIIAPWQHQQHDHPWDCWRVLPVGMQALFEFAGLECLEVGTDQNDCYGAGRDKT